MPSRLTQTEAHPSGFAAFHVTGPAAAQVLEPEDVELCIIQSGHTERYLDINNPAEPWTTSVSRFRPIAARRQGASVWFEVDIGVIFHMETSKPYKLRFRQADGLETEEVFTAPRMRRPARIPEGWMPPPVPSGSVQPASSPEAEAEPAVLMSAPSRESEPVAASVATAPVPRNPIIPQESGKPRWVWAALALLVVVAGAVGWYMTYREDGGGDSGNTMAADREPTLATIRADLARNPEPAEARAKADALAKVGKLLDGQFLLYKYAGEQGDRDAARILGGYYDPATWSKEASPMPAPNPIEAARWLKQAAEAGDAEAQYRYAMLLKSGGTDEASGPEQAVVWLRRAADQGHEEAKKEVGP
jgi:hypothetical protein